jgi:hypothetical protein
MIEMPTPAGRVLADAHAFGLGVIKHDLYTATHAACRLVLRAPDRLEHPQHILGGDPVYRQTVERRGVRLERGFPLMGMLGAAPGRTSGIEHHSSNVGEGVS